MFYLVNLKPDSRSSLVWFIGRRTSSKNLIALTLERAVSQRPIRGPPGPPDTPGTPDKISGAIPDTPDTPDTPDKIQIAQEGLLSAC
jgi:hypothetical protein